MFRGEYSLTLDAKGRLAIPSRYRERLVEDCSGKLIVTISLLERCLVVYPLPIIWLARLFSNKSL